MYIYGGAAPDLVKLLQNTRGGGSINTQRLHDVIMLFTRRLPHGAFQTANGSGHCSGCDVIRGLHCVTVGQRSTRGMHGTYEFMVSIQV